MNEILLKKHRVDKKDYELFYASSRISLEYADNGIVIIDSKPLGKIFTYSKEGNKINLVKISEKLDIVDEAQYFIHTGIFTEPL